MLPLYLGEPNNEPIFTRVIVAKRKVIPANSVTRVQCKLDKQLSEYIVELEYDLKVLIPRTVHDERKKPSICVVNASDNFVTIKKGRPIASAQEISKVTPDTAVKVTRDKMVKVTPVSPVIKGVPQLK